MCTREECFARLHEVAPRIQKEYGVTSMLIFGSMARGDNKAGSDVDLISWNADINSVDDWATSPAGMQRLAGNAMMIEAIGEGKILCSC